MKNIKQANINVGIKEFFVKWLDITTAFHNLTDQQKRVLALFLYYHYVYKNEVTNRRILWKLVFDTEIKKKVASEVGIKSAGLQNILTLFRKKNIINELNEITQGYIPDLENKSNNFKVVFNFNIVHESENR